MSEPAAQMVDPSGCRHLQLGLLALQLEFVTREQLLNAVKVWLRDKRASLGDLLERQDALSRARRELLERLAVEHLQQHENHVERSLVALNSLNLVREDLNRLGDDELTASFASVARSERQAVTISPADSAATPKFSQAAPVVGEPRFRVLRPHAEGGLGKVSLARDEELNREVALKEMVLRHSR